jgi:hypothetical protein
LKLFGKYVHGDISRRDFLQSVTQFAVGVSAMGVLDALNHASPGHNKLQAMILAFRQAM